MRASGYGQKSKDCIENGGEERGLINVFAPSYEFLAPKCK